MLKSPIMINSLLLLYSVARSEMLNCSSRDINCNKNNQNFATNGGMHKAMMQIVKDSANSSSSQFGGGSGLGGSGASECGMQKPSSMMEGVQMVKTGGDSTVDPQAVAECEMSKKKEYERRLREFSKELKKPISKSKKPCVKRFDGSNWVCYQEKMYNRYIRRPKWTVEIHDNVAELRKGNVLHTLMVYESIPYVRTKRPGKCHSFFGKTNLVTRQNAMGNIISVVGVPAKPSEKSKCTPCDANKVEGNTVEGSTKDCHNSCNFPDNIFYGTSVNDAVESGSKQSNKKKDRAATAA